MTTRELHKHVCEYTGVLRAASEQGWLTELLAAHWTRCSTREAESMIRSIFPASVPVRIRFTNRRGRATKRRRGKGYLISLPLVPGTKYGFLRAGLVLHEAAHVKDLLARGKLGHGDDFRRQLRSLVCTFRWRQHLMDVAPHPREIYDRHPGPYSLMLIRTMKHSGRNTSDQVAGPFEAQQAHDEAVRLVTDPAEETVTTVFVYSNKEGHFTGAQYERGTSYGPLEGRVDVVAQRPQPALLPGAEESVRPVGDVESGVPDETPGGTEAPVRRVLAPGARIRKSGGILRVSETKTDWPGSPAAQLVRSTLTEMGTASAAELAMRVGPACVELKVAHPGSLISRLKQAGLLEVVIDG